MDNETIAWISGGAAIGGGLICGLVSGAYQHWRDWFYRPILRLDYGAKEVSSIVSVVTSPTEGNLDHLYVRVRLKNTGRRVAKRCIAYLVSIEEVHQSGTKETSFSDAMPLSWPRNEYGQRDIPHGADFYIDLVMISKLESGWGFGVQELYANQSKMTSFRGTYRFHMVATADNCDSTKRYSVDVHYEQDWDTLRAFESPPNG